MNEKTRIAAALRTLAEMGMESAADPNDLGEDAYNEFAYLMAKESKPVAKPRFGLA